MEKQKYYGKESYKVRYLTEKKEKNKGILQQLANDEDYYFTLKGINII